MNELNITEATIISRLKRLAKVLYSSSTEKMSSEEFKEMLLVRQLADENRRCREAYKLQKLIEIKKKKLHLKMYPQKLEQVNITKPS